MKNFKIVATAVLFAAASSPAFAQFASQEPSAYASMHPNASIYSASRASSAPRESFAATGLRRGTREPALIKGHRKPVID